MVIAVITNDTVLVGWIIPPNQYRSVFRDILKRDRGRHLTIPPTSGLTATLFPSCDNGAFASLGKIDREVGSIDETNPIAILDKVIITPARFLDSEVCV